MEKKPLVSIITPTYNHEQYIGTCIESVLAQSYPYWEMIIIDDGSTDRTSSIISKYDDDRIKYIRQTNKGLSKIGETYNKALGKAEGELIAILEGDDFWPPYKLEKQVVSFENKNVVLSWGIGVLVNNNNEIIGYLPQTPKLFENLSTIEILKKLLLKNFIVSPTVMCRTDALRSMGGFKQVSYTPFVDYPTWLELTLVGEFYFINKNLGFWRRHPNQATQRIRIPIIKAGRRYSEEFFMRLPLKIKKELNINIQDLRRYNQRSTAWIYLHSGRKALWEKKWEYAREMFMDAFKYGSLSLKIKAIGGLIFSLLHKDIGC